MSFRTDALFRLTQVIKDANWKGCSEWLYKTLYGYPGQVQVKLASAAMKRYLPELERRWPKLEWPRELIEGPVAWVTRHEREVPDYPEMTHPADASFQFAFDAILLAAAYPELNDVVTAASACSIRRSVEALAVNAWAAADPEAVKISQELNKAARGTPEYLRLFREYGTRKPSVSPVANLARMAAWSEIVKNFQTAGVGQYPDAPPERVEADFKIWKDKNMLLVLPP
jgi:hypothetical protein